MEPGCGMADLQVVSSHKHISSCTVEADLTGKPLCFGHFYRGSELVPYGYATINLPANVMPKELASGLSVQ
jgi:hypothetical protein